MPSLSRTVRIGFWSSVGVLIFGACLLAGIVGSAMFLPAALTSDWQGIDAYATSYRATGGLITSLSFLAALLLCPTYVLQIASLHGLDPCLSPIRRRLGIASVLIFALLAGLNYGVQLTWVRWAILAGQDAGLAWLVFQNPDSLMLAIDFVAWFFLGLAFLSVLPAVQRGRIGRAASVLIVADAVLGVVLLGALVLRVPAIGQLLLGAMSGLLTVIDVLLIAFFRRARVSPA